MRPSSETVCSWAQHPVFDADLWLWVMNGDGTPVGLGIAEVDTSVSEGALEWIQVLPQYRGQGIGKAIVCELLSRLQSCVDFTTVSGEVDNSTHPEMLYRRCGFTGDDVWWLLRI
jgi:ribosomal protein S18 acetylase RimI-like enzyme